VSAHLGGKLVEVGRATQGTQNSDPQATLVGVTVDGQFAGTIALTDPLKTTTSSAIAELQHLGFKIIMVTGDRESIASKMAADLRLDGYHAGATPARKQELVKKLRDEGRHVVFAPALAAADVGIAMGNGTDVAIASAGFVLVKGDLRGLVKAAHLSRAVLANIKQNLFLAFLYNSVGIPIAAGALYPVFGWLLNPMLAGVAMSLSSISVVANALRLRNLKL
jgi:Cu+-exporting ATPase